MQEHQQTITTKRARQLLGATADAWTDAQVDEHVRQLDLMAALAINDLKRQFNLKQR